MILRWSHFPGPSRLEGWRTAAGLNQQQAADLLEVDLASYNSFEKGRERPGLDIAVRIEQRTSGKVSPSDWSTGKSERRPSEKRKPSKKAKAARARAA